MTNLSHKPFATLSTLSLVAGLFGACGDPYYSCEAKRACPDATGGEAAAAGDDTSNSGGWSAGSLD